jgi:hypothetical protein
MVWSICQFGFDMKLGNEDARTTTRDPTRAEVVKEITFGT